MAAAHYKLDNLTLIVDRNGLQIDGTTEDVMALGDLAAKFRAFGFCVKEIDGNDFTQVLSALDTHEKGKPVCIIAKTVKGKGVSFMLDRFCRWLECVDTVARSAAEEKRQIFITCRNGFGLF